MKIYRTDKIIKREKIRQNPDVLYLFGDNMIRKGLGGQAKEMRGEPNTVGIVTKKYPNNKDTSFFRDSDFKLFKDLLIEDMEVVISRIQSGNYKAIVIPQIGVGLAKLPDNAPKCFKLLQTSLKSLDRYEENRN